MGVASIDDHRGEPDQVQAGRSYRSNATRIRPRFEVKLRFESSELDLGPREWPANGDFLLARIGAGGEVFAERTGSGYRRLHVGERIPEPLAGTALTIGGVNRGVRRALRIGDSPGIVAGGFVFDVEDGAVYGREDAGRVAVLGVWSAAPEVLRDLARAHRLFIVDWCAAKLIRP